MTKTPQIVRRGFTVAPAVVLSPNDAFTYDYVPTAQDAKTDTPQSQSSREPAQKVSPKPKKLTQPKKPQVTSSDRSMSVQIRLAVSTKVESLSRALGPSFARELASALSQAVNAEIQKNGCQLPVHSKVLASANTVRCTVAVTPEVEEKLRTVYGQLAEKALMAIARKLAEPTITQFLKDKGIV